MYAECKCTCTAATEYHLRWRGCGVRVWSAGVESTPCGGKGVGAGAEASMGMQVEGQSGSTPHLEHQFYTRCTFSA